MNSYLHNYFFSSLAFCAAQEGQSQTDAPPLSFRFEIGPVNSSKTACFKPNPVASSFDHENHRAATLGAVYVGQCTKVPVQQSNPRLALVWEV